MVTDRALRMVAGVATEELFVDVGVQVIWRSPSRDHHAGDVFSCSNHSDVLNAEFEACTWPRFCSKASFTPFRPTFRCSLLLFHVKEKKGDHASRNEGRFDKNSRGLWSSCRRLLTFHITLPTDRDLFFPSFDQLTFWPLDQTRSFIDGLIFVKGTLLLNLSASVPLSLFRSCSNGWAVKRPEG